MAPQKIEAGKQLGTSREGSGEQSCSVIISFLFCDSFLLFSEVDLKQLCASLPNPVARQAL